jgi:hypothetical protein
MKWQEHVTGMGEIRNAYKISVTKPEEKKLLGRSTRTYSTNGAGKCRLD